MSIQRWWITEHEQYENPAGEWVKYADHVEALRQAEQRVEARWVEIARIDRENARADESKIMTRMALEAIDDAHERGIKRGQQDERKRSFLLIADAYKQGREQGQRDALAAATERVEVWAARSAYGLQAWDGLFRAIKGEAGMTGEDYEARKDEHRPDWPGYKQSVYPHVEWIRGHNVGWKDGLQAARDAVAALPVAITVVHDTPFLNKQGMGVCENPDKYPHGIVQVAALAAIDAIIDGDADA